MPELVPNAVLPNLHQHGVGLPTGVNTFGVTDAYDPDAPIPLAPGRLRYLCRVKTPNPARLFSFTLAGVSFEFQRSRTYSKKAQRDPRSLPPTHDLTPAQVDRINAMLPHCLLRPGQGMIKPVRQADGSYRSATRIASDVPLAPWVEFVPYIESADAVERIRILEAENAALRAKYEGNAAAVEAEEQDEAARAAERTGASRSTPPRHKNKGASGEVPGSP